MRAKSKRRRGHSGCGIVCEEHGAGMGSHQGEGCLFTLIQAEGS